MDDQSPRPSERIRRHLVLLPKPPCLSECSHSVQFFENDAFLIETVGKFLAESLKKGGPALGILAQHRLEPLMRQLLEHDIDVRRVLEEGRLVLLDAADTLTQFMVDGRPERDRFNEVIGETLWNLQRRFGKVHAYGEMVSLLWQSGNFEATLLLEHEWNRLGNTSNLALLCGYSIRDFFDYRHIQPFAEICAAHEVTVPSESLSAIDDDEAQRRAIALLQQKAEILERELIEKRRTEEQLRKRAVELARSNEELARFAHVTSHDLKEPLRVIKTYVQLLDRKFRDGLGDEAREYIDFTVESASRMQALIDDLLAYSSIDSRTVQPKAIDCNSLLQGVRRDLSATLSEKNGSLTYDALPFVWGETTQIAQVFQNLVSNSLKFCDGKRPQIHVSSRPVEGAHEFLVRDNGIGIEEEYFERIFILFQRLHDRGRYPGTGLGLAMCKKIIERHGGRIWLESRLGHGTTFYFTLPNKELETC